MHAVTHTVLHHCVTCTVLASVLRASNRVYVQEYTSASPTYPVLHHCVTCTVLTSVLRASILTIVSTCRSIPVKVEGLDGINIEQVTVSTCTSNSVCVQEYTSESGGAGWNQHRAGGVWVEA
jgi:hypothetical protein